MAIGYKKIKVSFRLVHLMKIKNIHLSNFLSFNSVTTNFDSRLTTIVGPNDSGKTNLFRAFNFVLTLLFKKNDVSTYIKPYFSNNRYRRPINIQIELSFDSLERGRLASFIIFSEMIRIKESETSDEETGNKVELLKRFTNYLVNRLFSNFILEIIVQDPRYYLETIVVRLRTKNEDQSELFMRTHFDGFIISNGEISDSKLEKQYFTNFIYNNLKDKLGDDVLNKYKKIDDNEIFPHLYNKFKSNNQNVGIIIPHFYPDKLFLRHMAQYNFLVNFLKMHERNIRSTNLIDLITFFLQTCIIIISNSRIHSGSAELGNVSNLYDHIITGEEIPSILFDLRQSNDLLERKRFFDIQRSFKEITGNDFDLSIHKKQETDSELNVSNSEPTKYKISIDIIKYNRYLVPINLAAAGLFEVLYLITILVGQTEKVILLDEPALNLHPNWQRKILEVIKISISNKNNQIFIITHSPFLIKVDDQSDLYTILRFYYKGEFTDVINIGTILDKYNKNALKEQKTMPRVERIIQIFGSSEIRSLLFCRGAVFVEGLADKVVFEMADRYLTRNQKGAGIKDSEWMLVIMESKDNLGVFIRLGNMLEMPYVAIVDYDALMAITTSITIKTSTIRTSRVFASLFNEDKLSERAVGNLNRLDKSIIIQDRKCYYPHNLFKQLHQYMKINHNILVLSGKIEDILSVKFGKKDSKVVADAYALEKLISKNNVPPELVKVIKHIHRRITSTRK